MTKPFSAKVSYRIDHYMWKREKYKEAGRMFRYWLAGFGLRYWESRAGLR